MNGSPQKMFVFMNGTDKRFLVPVYQRKYSWKEENCRQLYSDLKKLVDNPSKSSHFFGSIVVSPVPNTLETTEQIIDGQQRLTTITLLLLAMRNLLNKGVINSEKPRLAEEINDNYLIDPFPADPNNVIKLRPVEEDWNALVKIFDADESKYVKNSRLTSNYKCFCDILKKREVSVYDLFLAFKKLEIILIKLDVGDDAQLIFESLNSTGMALSEGDKIRNFVLMGLPARQQDTFYKKYWLNIEKSTFDDVSSFARDYLSLKQQITPTVKNVYRDFKEYVVHQSMMTEELLADLLKYAQHYKTLLTCNSGTDNKKLDACLYRLKRLDISVIRPFLMAVLEHMSEGVLTSDDVFRIFNVTENYLFRRNICDIPTNALNKIFIVLDKEVLRYNDSSDDYVSKFIYTIKSKIGSGRYPTNAEFYEALSVKSIYTMSGTFKNYLFERYQSYMGVGEIDVYELLDNKEYSIEHIMPQTLTSDWETALGADYENIHNTWIHRLANLTLTVCNSNLQNHTFEEKLNDENGGYIHSGLWMNQWIANKTEWGLDELEERSSMLCEKALDIWDWPETDFAPEKPNEETYALVDDDIDLTGCYIYKYSYQNIEHSVSTWVEMFLAVIKELHENDGSVLLSLSSHLGEDNYLEKYFAFSAGGMHAPVLVDEGNQIYVETNTNTTLKLSILRHLFAKYEDAAPEDLVFYLQN